MISAKGSGCAFQLIKYCSEINNIDNMLETVNSEFRRDQLEQLGDASEFAMV